MVKRGSGVGWKNSWVSELDLLSLVGYQKKEVDKNRSDELRMIAYINEKV